MPLCSQATICTPLIIWPRARLSFWSIIAPEATTSALRLVTSRFMRALMQRVTSASVTVGGETVGAIGAGVLVLVGVTHSDTDTIATKLADKVWRLRIFDDAGGVMNRSACDNGHALLVVSQFTLYGDTRKGRRPSWTAAAAPDLAAPLVECFVGALRALGAAVETGRFRTDMQVTLTNDGPVTVMEEVER